MSVKFLCAILGPEMAAPILWTPRISVFFLQENLHVHRIPRFWGGFWVWGGGKCRFYFYGRWDFSDKRQIYLQQFFWIRRKQICSPSFVPACPMISLTYSLTYLLKDSFKLSLGHLRATCLFNVPAQLIARLLRWWLCNRSNSSRHHLCVCQLPWVPNPLVLTPW